MPSQDNPKVESRCPTGSNGGFLPSHATGTHRVVGFTFQDLGRDEFGGYAFAGDEAVANAASAGEIGEPYASAVFGVCEQEGGRRNVQVNDVFAVDVLQGVDQNLARVACLHLAVRCLAFRVKRQGGVGGGVGRRGGGRNHH